MADESEPDRGVFGSMVATGDCDVVPAAEVKRRDDADEKEQNR